MSFLKNLIKTYKNVEEENEENIHGEINSEYVNAAEMRATLEYAREVLAINGFVEPVVRCDAALAAPPRNCDVGTAEEQQRRFDKMCELMAYCFGLDTCLHCPVGVERHECEGASCFAVWAQRPYEADTVWLRRLAETQEADESKGGAE